MKRGVTTVVIVLAVVIMFIILTVAGVSGSKSINNVNYEEYISQLTRVSDSINEYITKNSDMPISSYEVISKEGLTDSFKAKLDENRDTNNNLYVVDMKKLDISGVAKGNGTVSDRDIFLVAEGSNNVYYYKGYMYKKVMYYGI